MSVRDEILKHQGVLIEAKPIFGQDPTDEEFSLAGKFKNRAAAFGVRKSKDGIREIFYRVAIRPVVELPPALQKDCPVIFPKGPEFAGADVRIVENHWLTERVREEKSPEEHFATQTDVLLTERLTALSRLGSRMDTGDFSLQPSIEAHVKTNIRQFTWVLSGCFAVLVLAVVAVSVPFFFKPLGISGAKEGSSANSTLRSTRIARAQAELARSQRNIIPPGSNVFLMVTPDKTTVPVGGKVTLLYEVLTRYSAKCWGFNNEGKFQHFQVERKDPAPDTPRVVVPMNGKKFLKFSVGTATLVPQRAGEQVIYPGTAFVSARAESGQILDVYLTTKPMAINVVAEAAQESR